MTRAAAFANPWHDEIGRFAPKGTGTKHPLSADIARVDPEAAEMLDKMYAFEMAAQSRKDWGNDPWTDRPVDAFAALSKTGITGWRNYTEFEEGFGPHEVANQIRGDVRSLEQHHPELLWLAGIEMSEAGRTTALQRALARRVSGEDWGAGLTRKAQRLARGGDWPDAHDPDDFGLNDHPGAFMYDPIEDIAYAKVLMDVASSGPDSAAGPVYRGARAFDAQPGDVFDMPLGSGSHDRTIAERFAADGGRIVRFDDPVGIDVDTHGRSVRREREFLMSGRFEVIEVTPDDEIIVKRAPLVASLTTFANPWHDEIGRFAPKGTGTKHPLAQEMATWEETKPWNLTKEQAVAQSVPGFWHKNARETETASWDGKYIRTTDEFYALPEETRRAIVYHEAGHAMLEAAGGLTTIDDPLSLIDKPGGQALSYNAEEIIAEAYSVLWSEPEWFDRMGAHEIRDTTIEIARRAGFPLPDDVATFAYDPKRWKKPPPTGQGPKSRKDPHATATNADSTSTTSRATTNAPTKAAAGTPPSPANRGSRSACASNTSQFANPWHDAIGRFAPKGTGRKFEARGDAGPEARSTAEQMATLAAMSGGFTFDPRGNLFVEPDPNLPPEEQRGAVAVPGHSAIITMDAFRDPERGKQFIREYLDQHAETIGSNPNIFIGGWHDTANGEVVLDLSEVHPMQDAIRLGIERGEQAVFNLDLLEEVPTGGTGGRENVKIVDARVEGLVGFKHGSSERGPPPQSGSGRDGAPGQSGGVGRQVRGGEAGDRRLALRRSQFANPWHDEVGRFAEKGTGKRSDGRVSADEEEAAEALAIDKARNVPKPSEDDVIQGQVDALLAREGLVRAGGDRRGSNTQRKRRAKLLVEQFGDGATCPCADCGQRLAGDKTTGDKLGLEVLTQDKILVGTLGGSYKIENLIPACLDCNQSRGDREGVGVVGDVKPKWGSPERFATKVVRENGAEIAARFQARRKAILERKGISIEEHLADEPDAMPADWDELRRPVGGGFTVGEILTDLLDGGRVDGVPGDHVLGVGDPVRVDVPRTEWTLNGVGRDGVVEIFRGEIPPGALGPHHRAVSNHRRNGSFANPWHDEIGRFAPKGTGRRVGRRRLPKDNDKGWRQMDLLRSIVDNRDDIDAQSAAMVENLISIHGGDKESLRLFQALNRAVQTGDEVSIRMLDDEIYEHITRPAGADEPLRTGYTKFDLPPGTDLLPGVESSRQVWRKRDEYLAGDMTTRVQTSFLVEGVDAQGNAVPIILHNEGDHAGLSIQRRLDLLNGVADAFNMAPIPTTRRNRIEIRVLAVWPERQDVLARVMKESKTIIDVNRNSAMWDEADGGNWMPSANKDNVMEVVGAHEYGHVRMFTEADLPSTIRGVAASWDDETEGTMSLYGQASSMEAHAEAFSDWVITRGRSTNPATRSFAEALNWDGEPEEQALAAAGPPEEDLFTDLIGVLDGLNGPAYRYADGTIKYIQVGPVVASARQFANPWHDEIGRFAPKGTGVNFAKIARRADQAEAAGSTVSELDLESAAILKDRLTEFIAKMGVDFEADDGVVLTRYALNQRHGKGTMRGMAATDPDGVVLGAVAYNQRPPQTVGGEQFPGDYRIEFLGSTGLVKGVGTQLMIPVMRQAAADGASVSLKIANTLSAPLFWKSLGFEREWAGTDSSSMTAPEVQAWVANLDREHEDALVAAGPPDGWDPDDDRWAARAIELGLLQPAIVAAGAEFANPWHDEIGRFAPKGTGRRFGATKAELKSLFEPVDPLVGALEAAGARTYIVGGAARDRLLGIDAKDIDVEVHDLSVDDTIRLLEEAGAHIDEVGASFGVLKVTFNGETHDFSFPRTETKTGEGHTGFDVTVDPYLGIERALARRDFTMNALAVDSDGNMIDPYGGVADLQSGILRHVSPAFSEDPLRVLRGVQFAGRLGMTFDPDTAALARSLLPELETMHSDRVWGEFAKLGRQGVSMAHGAQALRDVGLDTRYGDIHFDGEPDLAGLTGDRRIAVALTSIGVDPRQIGAPHGVRRTMRDLSTALAFTGDTADSRALARQLEAGTFRDAGRIAGPIANVDPRVLDGPLPPLVSGNDVLARGVRGPAIGQALRDINQAQDDGRINTRDEALEWLDALTASAAEFANPWHDEIGRFAPKGSGRRVATKGVEDPEADAEFEEKYGNERPSGEGDCYPTALHMIFDIPDDEADRYRLVQGVPLGQGPIEGIRFGHAWIERTDPLPEGLPDDMRQAFEDAGYNVTVLDHSNGQQIEMPRVLYYQIGNINEADVRRFTKEEAMIAAVRAGHYGPWD
jgi:hypothetical protein